MTVGSWEIWFNWAHRGTPDWSAIPEHAWTRGTRAPGLIPGVWRIAINRGSFILWIIGPLHLLWRSDEAIRAEQQERERAR